MKIHAVDLVLPEQKINNDDVVERVVHYSKDVFTGSHTGLSRMISRLLQKSGSQTRFWSIGRAQPIEYVAQAVDRVMRKSNFPPRMSS